MPKNRGHIASLARSYTDTARFVPTVRSKKAALFQHLVGDGEQRWRHSEAVRLRGFEIDDELDFGRLQHASPAGLTRAIA